MGLRILFLTTDAYGGHGGIAYYNRCLSEALAGMAEVDEVVVVPRVMRFADAVIPPKIRFIAQSAGSKARYLRTILSLAPQVFDMVICGHVNLLPVAAPLSRFKRVPLVLQVHGVDVWDPISRAGQFWLKWVDAVWAVSAITRDRMNAWAKLPLAKYTIIPNTIHMERFGLGPKRVDLLSRYGLDGRKVVMTLARLAGYERYKGIDEILEVFPSLISHEPALTYLILGDGDDQPRLEGKARALGIAHRVVFAGYINEAEKADHFRLADVFALPGRGEGFGIVYLEALACGVPTVGSLVDGSREALLNGELGELVDPESLVSVRDGILRALGKSREIPHGLAYFAWPRFQDRIVVAVRAVRSLKGQKTI